MPLSGGHMKKPHRLGVSRRKAILSTLGVTCVGGGVFVRGRAEQGHWPSDQIRPPGALPETAFADACVRCGLCVQACPYDTLTLAGPTDPMPSGTPFFSARDNPCRMCETVYCVLACPTGALRADLVDIRTAKMGVAGLSDPQRCLSYSSAAYCDSCFKACPVKSQAIRMVLGKGPNGRNFTPTVDPAFCTGCGLCEKACVLDGVAAITVRASHAAA